MPQKRLILTLLAVFVLGITGAIVNSVIQTLDLEQKSTKDIKREIYTSANISGEGVSIVVTEGDRKKWTLNAKKILYYQNRNDAKLVGIEGLFFDDAGKPIMRFFAPEGNFINEDNEITLTGGVSAKTYQEEMEEAIDQEAETSEIALNEEPEKPETPEPEDTVELSAPKMQWSSRSKEVVAEGGVKLSHGIFGASTADKCIFTLDLSKLSMQGRATSSIAL